MRHQKAHRKLGRTSEHRMSMLRNLAVSLINARDERIVTTLPKAKELRPFVERAITLSRKASSLEGDDAGPRALHLRRQAAGFFHAGNTQQASLSGKRGQARPVRTAGMAALKRLFDELGERYKDRPGGYTRILKLGHRAGDNAELAIIELVGNPAEREALEAAQRRKTAPKKKPESKGLLGRRKAQKDAAATETEVASEKASGDTSEQETEAAEEK
jgi:large subunit ribosomal protein L17